MAGAGVTPSPIFDDKLFKAYEDGKHRRYSLLFSVNGGAFAVAKLLSEKTHPGVGNLTMDRLAWGMVLFTLIMCADIGSFGWKMRQEWKKSSQCEHASAWQGVFSLPGWIVLASLWLLISAGWLLVAG